MPDAMRQAMPGALPNGCPKQSTNETYVRTDVIGHLGNESQVPNAREISTDEDLFKIGDVIDLAFPAGEPRRLPVLNREPRPDPKANRKLWGALMERDGYRCWICSRGQDFGKFLVIDHLRPRSSFEPWNLWLADRSDNLRIACWECNQDKSNFELDYRSPVPVVWRCLVCCRIEGQAEELGWSADTLLAFCARHRENVNVPVDWPIAGLVHGVWQVAA